MNMLPPQQPATSNQQPAAQRQSALLLMVVAALFVIVSFLFWHESWFGRRLSNREIDQYLIDDQHPHKIQHALSQIADRIGQRDHAVKRWYPQVMALARHSSSEIRITAAWVMGQDPSSNEFHQVLRELLDDPALMVRRNAALELVRFRDASGRAEVVKMLQSYSVRAPDQGRVSIQLAEDQAVATGTRLARIMQDSKSQIEVRSPLSGRIQSILAQNGAMVMTGDELMRIDSDADQVWEALRGLYLVGRSEDLPDVERYASGVSNMPDRIREQAILTAKAIQTRAGQKANE